MFAAVCASALAFVPPWASAQTATIEAPPDQVQTLTLRGPYTIQYAEGMMVITFGDMRPGPKPPPAAPPASTGPSPPSESAGPPEWTLLDPRFPVGPFVPASACAHHCGSCGNAGFLLEYATGKTIRCPDCGGAAGLDSVGVCMCCHRSGKDGKSPALPLDVRPLPPDRRKHVPGSLKGGR